MTLPFEHHAKAQIESFSFYPPAPGKRPWLRDRWPVATIALGTSLTLVWLGTLVLLFALRI